MSFENLPEPLDLEFNLFKFTKSETKKNPVLIHHGIFSNKETYNTLAPLISKLLERDVYVFDARNHGKSPRTETLTLLDLVSDQVHFIKKNNFEKVILIGHSLGGKTYSLLSQMFPDFVEKLVIIDINPVKNYNDNNPAPISLFTTLLKTILEQINSSETKLTHEEALKKFEVLFQEKTKGIMKFESFKKSFIEKDGKFDFLFNIYALDSFAKGIFIDYHVDNQFLGEALLVYGGKSRIFFKEECESIPQKFVNCKFECVENGDHSLQHQYPDEFLKILKNFVDGEN